MARPNWFITKQEVQLKLQPQRPAYFDIRLEHPNKLLYNHYFSYKSASNL